VGFFYRALSTESLHLLMSYHFNVVLLQDFLNFQIIKISLYQYIHICESFQYGSMDSDRLDLSSRMYYSFEYDEKIKRLHILALLNNQKRNHMHESHCECKYAPYESLH